MQPQEVCELRVLDLDHLQHLRPRLELGNLESTLEALPLRDPLELLPDFRELLLEVVEPIVQTWGEDALVVGSQPPALFAAGRGTRPTTGLAVREAVEGLAG